MSDVTAFNNCMSVLGNSMKQSSPVFWHQDRRSEQAADCFQEVSCAPGPVQTASVKWRTRGPGCTGRRGNLLTDEYRAARDVVVLEDEIPLPDAFHEAVSTLEICLPETLQALPDEERWLIEEADPASPAAPADELGITLTAFKSRLLPPGNI